MDINISKKSWKIFIMPCVKFWWMDEKLHQHDTVIVVIGQFHSSWKGVMLYSQIVATILLEECEDDTHTPKMRTWESTGTPEFLEFDRKGQNTLHWDVLYIIGKLSKCRYWKWARMSHLDISSTSYDKKKDQESNPRVKLAIWLSTTKSQESTRPSYVQVVCNTPLKSFRWEL
jgi:hypothetical protein